MTPLFGALAFALALAAAVLILIFVLVPLLKGVGWLIGGLFRGIGFFVHHIFDFISGMIGDTLRGIGAMIATVVLCPMVLLSVVIGRWSAAGHYADSIRRECKVAGLCLYRVVLRRPLRLLFLDGLLEGVEQRVPEAMAAAPAGDKPSRRTGQFAGYTIVGSLRGGGSGAKLFIAEPDETVRARHPGIPDRVVIKSFALSEGSTLPQIVRESRALESAKRLGLVFDHGMDAHRFFYVMPYHPGDHLGIVTRQLHGETGGRGLEPKQLAVALGYAHDLVETLCTYHRGGLWHKDVKPENIIVNDGRARLVDLGLVTPLGSAMTLTTHGTEYFRDPELVRQALRGVKVHQIDGAKFDVYAAGAVLYFMLENTFPPHGALSRFQKKSPDAVRWIVRRAMADYTQRYETADRMLEDLRFVAAAPDPFALKPAQLPSMRGAAGEAVAVEEREAEATPAAFTTPPPRPAAAPVPGESGGMHAAAPTGGPARRPRIEVTNWWTGAYRVVDPGAAPPRGTPGPIPAPAYVEEPLRGHAAALRHEVHELRHKVQTGAISARRAAREQVRSARRRAREIRRRTRTQSAVRGRPGSAASRHLARAERQPTPWLAAIVLLVLAFGAFFLFSRHGGSSHSATVTIMSDDTQAKMDGMLGEALAKAGGDGGGGRPVLIVPRLGDPDAPGVRTRLGTIADEFRAKGYDVILDQRLVERSRIGEMLERWRQDGSRSADRELEDALETWGLYGVVDVTGKAGSGKVRGSIVSSSRPGAGDRRFVAAAPAGRPYVVINDHPLKHDPEVAERIDRLMVQCASRGLELVVDEKLEASVRKTLPAGALAADVPVDGRLRAILDQEHLGGVLYIHADLGAESPKSVGVTLMHAAPSSPIESAEMPSDSEGLHRAPDADAGDPPARALAGRTGALAQ